MGIIDIFHNSPGTLITLLIQLIIYLLNVHSQRTPCLTQKTSDSIKSKTLKSQYKAKQSQIDESLFGPSKKGMRSDEELKKVTGMVKKGDLSHP